MFKFEVMKHIKIEKDEAGCGSLEIYVDQDGDFQFEIDNPWSGDSESGFGRTETIYLSRDKAIQVRDFLNRMLE
jgi:hypothetical protein